MNILYKTGALCMVIMVLPGCGRIIDWGKTNFYQGKELSSFTTEVKPSMRSVVIYDQLETKAIFDVLWLSDEVRTAYAKLHILREGKSEEKLQSFLRRQLEENNHYITFYLLSTYEVKLGVPEAQWSLFLMLDGREYYPFEVKEIELPYEYQLFFAERWNRFKVPYIVRFKAMTDDEPLLTEQTKNMELIVRSGQKEHIFAWSLVNEPSLQESPHGQPAKMPRKIRTPKQKKPVQPRRSRKTRS